MLSRTEGVSGHRGWQYEQSEVLHRQRGGRAVVLRSDGLLAGCRARGPEAVDRERGPAQVVQDCEEHGQDDH